MKTKTLYMVEYSGEWNGRPFGTERDVYDHLHEAQEMARDLGGLGPVIYEIECRAVEPAKQGEGQ